jgi:hypothetical protein
METITEKYERLRPLIQGGDLILFHGTSIISKTIQNFDSAYYNHIGVVIEIDNALGICDANGDGVQWDRLSWRIAKYKPKGDFVIIRPLNNNEEIQQQLKTLLKRSDEKWIKYDYKNGIKEMFNRKFNLHLPIHLKYDKAICSSNDAQYAINLNLVTEEFKKLQIQFPQDYIRYLNKSNTKIIN